MRFAFQMNPLGAKCLDRVGGVGRFSGGKWDELVGRVAFASCCS